MCQNNWWCISSIPPFTYFISHRGQVDVFMKMSISSESTHDNGLLMVSIYFCRMKCWIWILTIWCDYMKVIMIKMSSYIWIKIIPDSYLLIYTLCEYKCWGGMVLVNYSISGNLVMWYNVLMPLVITCMTEPAGRINSHLEWGIIRVTFASYVTKPVLYPWKIYKSNTKPIP